MGSPSYCVGFESAELFWYRVYVEACRRGLGTALVTLVVVLGDDGRMDLALCQHYAKGFLAVAGVKVIEIVDIHHSFEHLEAVAEAAFGQWSETAKLRVGPLKQRLEAEGATPTLRESLEVG